MAHISTTVSKRCKPRQMHFVPGIPSRLRPKCPPMIPTIHIAAYGSGNFQVTHKRPKMFLFYFALKALGHSHHLRRARLQPCGCLHTQQGNPKGSPYYRIEIPIHLIRHAAAFIRATETGALPV